MFEDSEKDLTMLEGSEGRDSRQSLVILRRKGMSTKVLQRMNGCEHYINLKS